MSAVEKTNLLEMYSPQEIIAKVSKVNQAKATLAKAIAAMDNAIAGIRVKG